MQLKKTITLLVLLVFPLVVYLFFASGVNNFAKLPILKKNIQDIKILGDKHSETLAKKITVLCFLGKDIEKHQSGLLHLNQKIYQHFYGFKDFQFVVIQPKETKPQVEKIFNQLAAFTEDMRGWKVIYENSAAIQTYYEKLETNLPLDKNGATPYVFIIDKEQNIRGRNNDDEDMQPPYGYNIHSSAELHNKMKEDIRIVLAEYRLALKKNDKYKDNTQKNFIISPSGKQ